MNKNRNQEVVEVFVQTDADKYRNQEVQVFVQTDADKFRLEQARELLRSVLKEDGKPMFRELPDGSFVENDNDEISGGK
jgi:hypothetical protein